MRLFSICLLAFALACGDDSFAFDGGPDTGGVDVGPSLDGGTDGGPETDSGPEDAGTDAEPRDGGPDALDAGPLDAGNDAGPDAGPDAGLDAGGPDAAADAGPDTGPTDAGGPDVGSRCHAFSFGEPATEIQVVRSLPAMRGGVIPRGVYDAVGAQTTGAVTGTYRGTWVFEDETTLHTVEQITLSGSPPAATPRTQTYRTTGTSLLRTRTCAGDEVFDNEYEVRMEDGRVFLDIRAGGLLFTFRSR